MGVVMYLLIEERFWCVTECPVEHAMYGIEFVVLHSAN